MSAMAICWGLGANAQSRRGVAALVAYAPATSERRRASRAVHQLRDASLLTDRCTTAAAAAAAAAADAAASLATEKTADSYRTVR